MKIKEIKNGNLNSVYKLKLKHKYYVIRLSDFDNNFESLVLKILESKQVNAPHIKTNFMFQNKYVMIYDYIDGKNPTKFNEIFFKRLMEEVKKLHCIDIKNINSNNDNGESIKRLEDYYAVSIKSEYLSHNRKFLTQLLKEIKQNLNLNILPKVLIHSDIKRENVLVDNQKLYLIDFGNCYVGNRLVDIIRILMWFFIKDDNYDLVKMNIVLNAYFDSNNKITKIEKENLAILLRFCLLYNLLKDLYLYENKLVDKKYIEKNSLKWLDALKNKKSLSTIVGVFDNVERFTE